MSINWVITGGESGPGARPSNPQWYRDLRDECEALAVHYLHKQNGEWVSVSEVEGPGPIFMFDDHRAVRRVGKKAAGRLLDGVEHNGFPRSAA
jgi:protein gp37